MEEKDKKQALRTCEFVSNSVDNTDGFLVKSLRLNSALNV